MTKIELTAEERTMLAGILEYDLKELINEISNTENWEYKRGLKSKEEFIKKLLGLLNKGT